MIIYKWTLLIDNRVYIGQTITSLEERIRGHLKQCKNKKKSSYLHRTINKYGFNSFKVEIIEYCYSRKELDIREKYWIKYYNSNNPKFGFNCTDGGKSTRFNRDIIEKIKRAASGKIPWNKGLTKETDKRIKEASENFIPWNKGLSKNTDFRIKEMSKKRKGAVPWIAGKRHSKEAKQKMSVAKLGKKLSREHVKNMCIAQSGENNPMFGRKHSLASRKKISDSLKHKNNSLQT